MAEIKTSILKEELSHFNKVSDAVAYINQQKKNGIFETFKDFWDNYIYEHNITLKQNQICALAGLASSTGNDVLNGKNIPKRDTCLALCFAIGMNVEDTNRALRCAGHSKLSEKSSKDYVFMIYCEQHAANTTDIHNVTELNLALVDAGVEPLNVSK